jgi:Tfp pilus assembly protein PilF
MLAFVDLDATLTNYGLVLFSQGKYGQARRAFEDALGMVGDPMARRKLNHDIATSMLADGDAAGALVRLEPEVSRSDALQDSLRMYAKALDALGRSTEADATRRRILVK